jgi:hypothetical protein
MTFTQALGLMTLVNLAVRVLPFRPLAASLVRGLARSTQPCEPARLAAIVARAASWCWPAPSCLTRSLVLCRMLVRRGVGAELVLGVQTRDGRLTAHAWVEHDGRKIHDDAALTDRFTTLCRIDHRGVVTPGSP